ncbi:MAG: hypothetical protein AVDCRST_MAG11-2038, partial [uncultured Gemmatimonadaceae bacterium]
REHQHRREEAAAAQLARDVEAALLGEPHVEDHERRRQIERGVQAALPVGRGVHAVAAAREGALDKGAHVVAVLDHQHRRRRRIAAALHGRNIGRRSGPFHPRRAAGPAP